MSQSPVHAGLRDGAMHRGRSGQAASLGVLAFWAALWVAGRHYPSAYDWRYMTISNLLYPDRDPGGYLWAWSGVVLCGLAGLWWAWSLRGPSWLLRAGYALMVACAVWPAQLLPVRRGHELLAIAAFVGVTGGLVQRSWRAVLHGARPRGPASRRGRAPRPHLTAAMVCALALSPALLAALSQVYVAYALPGLPWVGMSWRARGIPVCLSFAFWEWLTCAVLSVYMLALARGPRSGRPQE